MKVLPASLLSFLSVSILSSQAQHLGQPLHASKAAKNVLESKLGTDGYCSPSGPIENTLCEYETVEKVNARLYPQLAKLVQMPFFKYYKVDLFKECPFWYENAFCMNRQCGVETADEDDVPEKWREETWALSAVHLNDDPNHQHTLACQFRDKDFCQLDDESGDEGQYVDLTMNPERFTGYAGESAHRVWKAIYEENCFGLSEASTAKDMGLSSAFEGLSQGFGTEMRKAGLGAALKGSLPKEEVCVEKKVYYRIVSGLHASISTHICNEWLDPETGIWAPSLQCFIDRVATHPERLQNMYFNAVILMRAVARVGRYLDTYDFSTGDLEMDKAVVSTLGDIVSMSAEKGHGFDENAMFHGEDAYFLKDDFKRQFRNVSQIMDCVGCDKCRLWGKLQFTGVGTALKILFELEDEELEEWRSPGIFQRGEIVALFNTLHRLSESLNAVSTFRALYAETQEEAIAKLAAASKSLPASPSPSQRTGTESHRPPLSDTLALLLSRVNSVMKGCQSSIRDCIEICLHQLQEGWYKRMGVLFDKHEGVWVSGEDVTTKGDEKRDEL